MLKFNDLDTVQVVVDRHPVARRGEIGVVVMTFDSPCEAYEVEFTDAQGRTTAQGAFLPNELELVPHHKGDVGCKMLCV